MPWVGDPNALFILHSSSKDWDFFDSLFEVNRGTKPVFRDLCEVPNVSGACDILTGKRIVEKGILENILNNTKTQVIVPFCVSENRSASVRIVHISFGLCFLRYAFVPFAFIKSVCDSHKENLARGIFGMFHHI